MTLLTWLLVAGAVVLGIIVVTIALLVLAGRIRPFRRAARRLSLRTEQAQALQVKAMVLQEQAMSLQDGLAETVERHAAQQRTG